MPIYGGPILAPEIDRISDEQDSPLIGQEWQAIPVKSDGSFEYRLDKRKERLRLINESETEVTIVVEKKE